jgi:cell division protein FtsB
VAVAAPARASPKRAAPPPAPAPSRGRRPRRSPARPRLARSVLWIGVVAALLAGIVAVNVAALRLRLDAQRLAERKERLVGENAAAASELSTLASAERIEVEARRLGLVRPNETTYVKVRPGRR